MCLCNDIKGLHKCVDKRTKQWFNVFMFKFCGINRFPLEHFQKLPVVYIEIMNFFKPLLEDFIGIWWKCYLPPNDWRLTGGGPCKIITHAIAEAVRVEARVMCAIGLSLYIYCIIFQFNISVALEVGRLFSTENGFHHYRKQFVQK